MRRVRSVGAVLLAAVAAFACGSEDEPDSAADGSHDDVVHVHDLLVRDDDTVLAATHTGLYAVSGDGLDPIGSGRHDLMAAVLDGDTILASGHPDLRDDTLRAEGRPPLLGVVESTDGEAWTERSLLGEADFHRLVFAEGTLFAANSSADAVWVSEDAGESWEPRAGTVQLVAMAVDPADPAQMIGTDLERGLVRSADGGDTWVDVDGPELVDLEWSTHGIVGLGENGAVHRLDDRTWTPTAELADAVALGTRGDDELFALRHPATVQRSTDGGTTWKDFP